MKKLDLDAETKRRQRNRFKSPGKSKRDILRKSKMIMRKKIEEEQLEREKKLQALKDQGMEIYEEKYEIRKNIILDYSKFAKVEETEETEEDSETQPRRRRAPLRPLS